MRRFIGAICIICSIGALANAQQLHGKILVVSDSNWFYPHDFDSILPSIYHGRVDLLFHIQLPTDLSEYDAVAILRQGWYDSLRVGDQLSLIQYLKAGGRVYAENSGFFLGQRDTLWHFIGLHSEQTDNLLRYCDSAIGVDSEFTRGFTSKVQWATNQDYLPQGNFVPVLLANEWDDYRFDPCAWIPKDTTIRALMFHNKDHFNEYGRFLQLVFCNYFGLCSPLMGVASQDTTAIAYRSETSVTIFDVMGRMVASFEARGDDQIEPPKNLPSGFYFILRRTCNDTILRRIVIAP